MFSVILVNCHFTTFNLAIKFVSARVMVDAGKLAGLASTLKVCWPRLLMLLLAPIPFMSFLNLLSHWKLLPPSVLLLEEGI